MNSKDACPGCGERNLDYSLLLARQPVVLNYRFASSAESRRVKRRDIHLAQCTNCGLVFNGAFDPEVVPYDSNYENRQCFSAAFQEHLRLLANRLSKRNQLREGSILEIGCGKGDFLTLLCRLTGAKGTGYDTTYEANTTQKSKGLVFHRQYVTSADIREPFDVVICRHVIEHVPDIGQFLHNLRLIAEACGNPLVALETPRYEWIVENRCLWDIFYEHCNYFSMRTLAYLCQRSGFRVVEHVPVFGGQYQFLELRLQKRPRFIPPSPPHIPAQARLKEFAANARANICDIKHRIKEHGGMSNWAIWGAGAKGVALVHLLRPFRPRFVIDSNAAKQGCVIPGSSISVISPDDPRIAGVRLVLVANPNYCVEITSDLRKRGHSPTILTL